MYYPSSSFEMTRLPSVPQSFFNQQIQKSRVHFFPFSAKVKSRKGFQSFINVLVLFYSNVSNILPFPQILSSSRAIPSLCALQYFSIFGHNLPVLTIYKNIPLQVFSNRLSISPESAHLEAANTTLRFDILKI